MKKSLKYIVFSIVMTITLCSYANARQLTQQDNQDFITYYYLHKQDVNLISLLKNTLQADYARGFNNKLLEHFYAAIINDSKNKNGLLKEVIDLKIQYTGAQLQIIDNIIEQTTNFYSPPANSKDNFDFLWAEFFATGHEQPIKKIADYLNTLPDKQKDKIVALSAAEWSLASNAQQHKRVYEILNKTYASSHGIMKKRLKIILDDPANVVDVLAPLPHTVDNPNNAKLFRSLVLEK